MSSSGVRTAAQPVHFARLRTALLAGLERQRAQASAGGEAPETTTGKRGGARRVSEVRK